MENSVYKNGKKKGSYIVISDNKITETSLEFSMLTGFTILDFIGENLEYAIKLLKIRREDDYYYIFSKNSEPIKVMISNTSDYYSFTKLPDFKLQDTFKNMNRFHLNKGRGLAIYNASDLLLLKSNPEYENFLCNQYNETSYLIGKTLYEVSEKHIRNLHISLFQEVLKTGEQVCKNSFNIKTYNDEDIFLDITLVPIYEKEKLIYIIESFTDVTEFEKQKLQISYFEKQKEFFSFICHEFKTPLTVIISAVQAIKLICKDELSLKSLKYIKKIHQGSLQQWRLVTHLLDILKTDSGYLQLHRKNLDIVRMTKAITEAVSEYAITKGINIKFSSSVKELIIGIDDEKYERVLLNLLSNAIKYTPSGNSIYINAGLAGDKIKITVRDTGIGIPKDKIDTIFELFSRVDNSLTRESEGTGIGLYLVKQLITTMNGEIKVISKPKRGSSFMIFLPIEKVEEEDLNDFSLDATDNHLIDVTNIEFSNIYFD